MRRFVLLYHDCSPDFGRPSHWDLMLDSGDLLRTWALEQLPQRWQEAQARTAASYQKCAPVATSDSVSARMLADHRRDYLSFEGELSGDRGAVIQVAAGTFVTERESDGEWSVTLSNSQVDSKILLTRSGLDGREWTLEVSDSSGAAN